MDFPSTQLEFERRFSSEGDCIEYLRRLRWPDGFV
ncbi:MAG TPA: IS1595 family transposase, partial [Myxococcales bacterium]